MNNNNSYIISVVLDTRRKKSNNKFPVKLRVYSKVDFKKKLYSIGVDLTEKEFENIWSKSTDVRGENRETRILIQRFETRANDEAEKLNRFSFQGFERRFFRKSSDANDIVYHFKNTIENNIKKGKISSSESFICSLKSINHFNSIYNKKDLIRFPFETITVDWLEAYEGYMLTKDKSISTVGVYLRALRIIFNNAIKEGDINKELYPFGKGKYQIPESTKVKKALNNNELKILFQSIPKTIEQVKAKDFWFFSYTCNGMNNKDIALLKYSDLEKDKFTYYRAKTFSKSRVKTKIEIYLNNYSREIIEKYKTKNTEGYLFPILHQNDDDDVIYKKVKNFTRFINQHLKKLAEDNGITSQVSSYWARHSFATNSIRKGASKEFISEALNHSDMKVTENYFAGFEDDVKKEFADKLMDF